MAELVIMPRQGQSVESCIFTEWFKKKGEKVSKGDLLFSYETDKAAFEQEAEADGILLETFVDEGDEVPVLQVIGVIGAEGESVEEFRPGRGETVTPPALDEKQEAPAAPEAEKVAASAPAAASGSGSASSELKISPRARNLAQKRGVDYTDISGSGPYGRIIAADIEKKSAEMPRATPLARAIAQEEKIPLPPSGSGPGGKILASDVKQAPSLPHGDDYEDRKLSNVRRIIATNMFESLANTAQLTLHASADARRVLEYRKMFKKKKEEGYEYNITINDLVVYAVIKAVLKHPDCNAHFMGERIRFFKNVHLGFAVDTPRGLMVPTVLNANHLTIEGLSAQMKKLAADCQQGSIDPQLFQGASFTVTNLGAYGIEMFTPVLNPPQVAILGINTIVQRPADLGNGVFGFVPRIGLSLTFDHRAIDGAPAAAFLQDAAREIENIEINL